MLCVLIVKSLIVQNEKVDQLFCFYTTYLKVIHTVLINYRCTAIGIVNIRYVSKKKKSCQ